MKMSIAYLKLVAPLNDYDMYNSTKKCGRNNYGKIFFPFVTQGMFPRVEVCDCGLMSRTQIWFG